MYKQVCNNVRSHIFDFCPHKGILHFRNWITSNTDSLSNVTNRRDLQRTVIWSFQSRTWWKWAQVENAGTVRRNY